MSCTTTPDLPSPVAPRPSKVSKSLREFRQSKAVKCNPLSFDMLINGYSCSPCTIRDFMNYLLYIERAAENLQFYLWLKDYTRRFALIPDSERELSPAWNDKKQVDGLSYRNRSAAVSANVSQTGEGLMEPPDLAFDRQSITSAQTSFSAAPGSIRAASDAGLSPWDGLADFSPRLKPESVKQVEELPELSLKGGKDHQLLMSQPFRMEVSRIIAIYVVDGAPRQLNLTAKERDTLLRALSTTTHPTAFDEVAAGVEWFLRQQSHPNFIRWSRHNSNRSRVICARMFGGVVTLLGLVAGMLPIFSKASRAWRIFSVLLLLPGLLIFIAAWKGACVLFLCMDRRHLHPWEFFGEENEHTLQKLGMYNGKAFDVLGEANSYEDEPWIPKYEKRNFFRRVFDPAARIQDPEMRRIQRLVLLKVLILSCLSCAALLAIFIAVPRGNFF